MGLCHRDEEICVWNFRERGARAPMALPFVVLMSRRFLPARGAKSLHDSWCTDVKSCSLLMSRHIAPEKSKENTYTDNMLKHILLTMRNKLSQEASTNIPQRSNFAAYGSHLFM